MNDLTLRLLDAIMRQARYAKDGMSTAAGIADDEVRDLRAKWLDAGTPDADPDRVARLVLEAAIEKAEAHVYGLLEQLADMDGEGALVYTRTPPPPAEVTVVDAKPTARPRSVGEHRLVHARREALLENMYGRVYSVRPATLAAQLEMPPSAVYNDLYHLREEGRIKRQGRGMYRLTQDERQARTAHVEAMIEQAEFDQDWPAEV